MLLTCPTLKISIPLTSITAFSPGLPPNLWLLFLTYYFKFLINVLSIWWIFCDIKRWNQKYRCRLNRRFWWYLFGSRDRDIKIIMKDVDEMDKSICGGCCWCVTLWTSLDVPRCLTTHLPNQYSFFFWWIDFFNLFFFTMWPFAFDVLPILVLAHGFCGTIGLLSTALSR